jgi:hypothetical protein
MPAEYLQREEQAEVKHELIEGAIIPVAGTTADRNILTGKFHARLLLALEDSDYTVFMSDILSVRDRRLGRSQLRRQIT